MRLLELQKKLFFEIRDLPFEVIPGVSFLNYKKAIESIKRYRKGSCTSKHFYLGKLYEKKRLKVVYVTYIFYWEEQDYLNNDLKQIAKHLPEQYHLALIVEDKLIDATFDKLLAPTFPVNEFENCKVAVNYIDKIFHKSPKERILYVKSRAKKSNYLRKFYGKLNEYTRKIRKINLEARKEKVIKYIFKNVVPLEEENEIEGCIIRF